MQLVLLDCFHANSKDGVTKQSLRKHKFGQDRSRINKKRHGRNGHKTNHVNSGSLTVWEKALL